MPRMTCSPETEVIGVSMISFVDNIQADVMAPMLVKHDLVNIEPDRWYPVRSFLEIMDELSTQPEFTNNMIAVGLKVAQYAITPPEMQGVGLAQMLEGWDTHFHANHRNGDVGHIITEKVNDKAYRVTHQNIYPDDFNYGLAYGFAKTCLPHGTNFVVKYEDYNHRLDLGNGDKTVITVSWG